MQEYKIEKLHEVLVEILDYVVSVCEENNLKYFLLYGSALGAYRHHACIPWDDDLDIGMPRDDYEKFIDIMKTQPSSIYCLQNDETESQYYLTFSKIRKKNTIFMEDIAEGMYQDNGIFIDVFPLDYVKDKNALGYRVKEFVITYLNHGIRYLAYPNAYKNKYSKLRNILEGILCFPLTLFSKKKTINLIKKLCKGKCKPKEATYLAEYCDAYQHASQPIDNYLPEKKLMFHGREYNVPGKIENYLSTCYGEDYMELPPVEKRVTHMPSEIKF